MMSSISASAVGLLERELLLFPFVIQWADRRIMVGPVKHDAPNDLNACPERNRVSWKPPSGVHGKQGIFPAADESDIERIAWNAIGGARHHGQ
jgi:hypothetical protein